MARKRRKQIVCPNCEQKLKEHMNYCLNCGQENHIKRVSLKMIFNDFFATFFTFESKFFTTIGALVFKPAYLSNEFLKGKIEKYLRPIRLYFFISFAFFLLLKISPSLNKSLIDFKDDGKELSLKEVRENINKDKKEEAEIAFSFDNFGPFIEQKTSRIIGDERNYKMFVNSVIDKSPIFLFFLIPFFSGLLFLIFYKKKYYYVDHFVFALHLQSFYFTLLLLELIIDWVTGFDLIMFFLLVFLVYGFIAARKFYGLKKMTTFFRLCVVGFLYMLIGIFFASVFLIVMVGYIKF